MKICEETAPGAARARARNDTAEVFESHRPRLFRLAYRMLGSRFDAEDLVQDAYLRWHQSATQDIQSPVAFLVTITTRLCLDRLRELKQEREHYVGRWLPEPIVEDLIPSPEMQLELADEVSIAFLVLLERLGPEERAAFLLHEIVDYDYPEVAQMLGKTEPACRQMIHRARIRVRESRPRFSITTESRERVLGKFLTAVGTRDRKAVMALLAEEVAYTAAGGGKVVAALNVPGAGGSAQSGRGSGAWSQSGGPRRGRSFHRGQRPTSRRGGNARGFVKAIRGDLT
jgi:RNA polymerase sigma-70 factor (ECF subfamily)